MITGRGQFRPLNLPWSAEYVEDELYFPWLILDEWGVVIARFDFESQARACVDRVNGSLA